MPPPHASSPQLSGPAKAAFGARLAAWRKARGISQRGLAQAVGLTPEHLSRIERGRRPPPRRAVVLRLAGGLGAGPGDDVERALLTSAGYAPDSAIASPAMRFGPARAMELDWLTADNTVLPGDWEAAAALIARLPPVITGTAALARAARLLLRAAAAAAPRGDDQVFLSLSAATQALLVSGEAGEAWHALPRRLLGAGWRFRHLWQLQPGISWPEHVIAELTALVAWPGRYEPCFVYGAEPFWFPQDLLVVPGFGALTGLRAGPGAADAALVVRDPEQVRSLSAHAARLAGGATPMLSSYLVGDGGAPGNASRVAFTEALTGAHELLGEHRLVKQGIPLRFVPSPSWWQTAHRGLPLSGAARGAQELAYRRTLWECRLRSRRVLAEEMRSWRYREICSTRGIRQFAEHGVVSSDDFLLDGLPPLPREERADALLGLLGQLTRNPNYELALLEHEQEQLATATWVVKGTSFFCLEAVQRAADQERQDFMAVVTDERLVTGFRDHFDTLWERLPARCRDKPRVEQWLDRQIARLN